VLPNNKVGYCKNTNALVYFFSYQKLTSFWHSKIVAAPFPPIFCCFCLKLKIISFFAVIPPTSPTTPIPSGT